MISISSLKCQQINMKFAGKTMKLGNFFSYFSSSITRIIKNMELLTEETLEELFKLWQLSTIASAEDESSIKLYLYCKLNQG